MGVGGTIGIISGVAASVGLDVMGLLTQAVFDVNFTVYGLFPFGFHLTQPFGMLTPATSIANFVAGGIPAPTRLRVEIENKLVEIPIVGMNGNKLQYLGRKAPKVVFEGEFLYPYATVAVSTFSQMIKGGKSLPFFTTLIPCFRMMKCRRFVYEPIPERSPGDIRYEIELVQDRERGFP